MRQEMNFSCLVDIQTKILCPARKLTLQERQKKVALINKMAKRDSVPKSARQDGFTEHQKARKMGPRRKEGTAQSRLSISYFSLADDYIKDEGQA
jgi:hypothetical protein